jgi:hypothetical protein
MELGGIATLRHTWTAINIPILRAVLDVARHDASKHVDPPEYVSVQSVQFRIFRLRVESRIHGLHMPDPVVYRGPFASLRRPLACAIIAATCTAKTGVQGLRF